MYVKSCPEVYAHKFTHKNDATMAGIIQRAISRRTSPKQFEVADSSDETLAFEFRAQYDFHIIINKTRYTKTTKTSFHLDVGCNMSNHSSADLITSATRNDTALILPYVYKYPAKRFFFFPYQKEESGVLSVYAICKNAPADDMGRVLVELVAGTYIKTIEKKQGHFFQVSTESFRYGSPYDYPRR